MRKAMSGIDSQIRPRSAAALLVPCASRKRVRPAEAATASSLPAAHQRVVQKAWQNKLGGLPAVCPAGELYAGRGALMARQAAELAGSNLFFISAGLGLIDSALIVPT